MITFSAKLSTMEGKGGWTFISVPADLAPPVLGAWGMTPVLAMVDGREWATTIWRDKTQSCLLPVPKKIRAGKGHGDLVEVSFRVDVERAEAGNRKPKRGTID